MAFPDISTSFELRLAGQVRKVVLAAFKLGDAINTYLYQTVGNNQIKTLNKTWKLIKLYLDSLKP